MSTFIGIASVTPTSQMAGDSPEDTELLESMLGDARAYLSSFPWCARVLHEYFGLGVGGIVAVFLFQIEARGDADEWLWVVSGDIPSAYLVTDEALTPRRALHNYCELMQEWIDTVKARGTIDAVFPVAAEPTSGNASSLQGRIDFIRRELLGESS